MDFSENLYTNYSLYEDVNLQFPYWLNFGLHLKKCVVIEPKLCIYYLDLQYFKSFPNFHSVIEGVVKYNLQV